MLKRKDNDIFGTANIGYAPRIQNDSKIDPNVAFRKRSQQNYERYQSGLTNIPQSITARPLDASKVNENVQFQQDYHRIRKEKDMQSSIFYPPKQTAPRHQDTENDPMLSNKPQELNYGRKEVFKREINGLPFNTAQLKGNSSRLFDLDQRIKFNEEGNIPLAPLIPHQMNWDQHDSIKYSHINPQKQAVKEKSEINQIDQSKSTVFQVNQETKTEQKTNKSIEKNNEKKVQNKAPQVQQKKQTKPSQAIEIKIIKGWEHKFMEGLSKHCKLNNSAILGFQIDVENKVFLTIKKSDRWENVTDWLRKDCKLKLRI